VWQGGATQRGKINEIAWLTSLFTEEIEADLQRYYGLDFTDLFIPGTRLTWRKLLVLIHHLPPESAVNTAVRNKLPDSIMARQGAKLDPAKSTWSSLESLMALLIDEIRQQTWTYVQSKSEKRVPRPTPIRRPGLPERRERTITLEAAQRLDPRLSGLSEEEAQRKLDNILGVRTGR
jgi:hypothetical protein